MTENTEETYEDFLKRQLEAAKKRAASFDNSLGVIMTNALDAAQQLHIARYHGTHAPARAYLLRAMHSVLIVAEQCRQEMERDLTDA